MKVPGEIRKAIIPVARLGIRSLLTMKAQLKDMLVNIDTNAGEVVESCVEDVINFMSQLKIHLHGIEAIKIKLLG